MIKAEAFKWLDRVYHLFHLGSYLCLSGALADCFLPLDEKKLRKSGNTVFSIINLWELSVAMETRVLIRSGPKAVAAFPPS